MRRSSGIALRAGLLSAAVAAAVAVAVATSGCDGRALGAFRRNGARAEPLVWTGIDLAGVGVWEDSSRRIVRFQIDLPAAPGAGQLRQLELRFAQPLDGAKVDVDATGARQAVTLLEGRRAAGATVLIPLAPLPLARIQVTVHHHLRPAPLLQELRLGRVRPPAPRAPQGGDGGGEGAAGEDGERR